jgi:3-dehydroquinate dehydratase-2
MKIAIVNGPNLNLVGTREPEVYGHQNMVTYLKSLSNEIPEIDFETFQSNIEGELIDFLQQVTCDVIILNAGAFTHTSIAIGDTVAAISTPVIELHISNVYQRERFRTHSYIAPHAKGIITGFGIGGYKIAVGAALAL